LEQWVEKYYSDYRILDLPVPVEAEPKAAVEIANGTTAESKARENATKRPTPTGVAERLANDGQTRGGQNLFDRKAYQRTYMKAWRLRKKRAAEKVEAKG
jgi:hypothetical protein